MAPSSPGGPRTIALAILGQARHERRESLVSCGVVTQIQQILARRPVLDLAIRALVLGLLALVILVVLPALASAAG